MKGQVVIIGLIMSLIALIIVSLVFMPIYKDLVENQTSGWNNAESLVFKSIGAFVILVIVIGLLNTVVGYRERQF